MAMKLDISKAYDCVDWGGVSERYPGSYGLPSILDQSVDAMCEHCFIFLY